MKCRVLKTRNYMGGLGLKVEGDIVEIDSDLANQYEQQGFMQKVSVLKTMKEKKAGVSQDVKNMEV